jgi:aspartate carbamoyltransferase catalytic subunit
MEGRSIISSVDLNRVEVLDLLDLAAKLQSARPKIYGSLQDLIVLTAFFEPSTRTRLSFESAALRLGANVISVPDGRVTSSQKGETLSDIGAMLKAYADLIVLRHPSAAAPREIRRGGMDLPLINGGNGWDEHPTQAMADWFALLKWRPALADEVVNPTEQVSVGMVGTPRRMRSLRSFLLMAANAFPTAIRELVVVSEIADPIGLELGDALRRAGIPIVVMRDFDVCASSFDIVYVNSLTLVGTSYHVLEDQTIVNAASPLKPDAVVMHPLARLEELSDDLDDTPHNLYFDQAEGAVFVRQALLLAIAGRVESGIG